MRLGIKSKLNLGRLNKKWRHRLAWFTFILLITLVVWLVDKNITSKNYGIVGGAAPQTPAAAAAASSVGKLDSPYFSLSYPGGYKKALTLPKSGNLVAGWVYESTVFAGGGNSSLSINYLLMPDGGLSANPNYNSLSIQPNLYTITDRVVAGETAKYVISKSQIAPEQYAFIPHSSRLLTISLSFRSGGDNQTLTQEMNTILNSLKWK